MKDRLKIILLSLTIIVALGSLWYLHNLAETVRHSEEEKVRLWANAITQRSHLATATTEFFREATIDEHRKMQMYINILQSFNNPDMGADMQFSLNYVNYIVDSSHTPIIITTANDSIITVPQELMGQKLEGKLLEEYSVNPPFHYKLWGMPMTLYYKESKYYAQMREVLFGFTRSFLMDITRNSVQAPVIIVDSTHTRVVASGNIDSTMFDTPQKLAMLINKMNDKNDPIEITLSPVNKYYVYYAQTAQVRALRWMPLLFVFIAIVLLVVSYNLFRTTRSMEQNKIWVGLAKETAHQLGTPLSSLIAWSQYLRGKEFTDQYGNEIDKDLHRLEVITQRFSKIGSVPELKPSDVKEATFEAVSYLQSRSPRKVSFNVTFPDEESYMVPLNNYLFQWVIENLCKNAIDAMEGSGSINIVGSQDARNIYIDVSDTGKGMTPSVQKKIFESGFSTKTRGWGLGLPLAHRIINQYHKGRLYLKYSVPGQGSVFRIVLKK